MLELAMEILVLEIPLQGERGWILKKNVNFWDEKVEKYLKSVPDYSGI